MNKGIKIDKVTHTILEALRIDVEKEFGVGLSETEILAIVNSQFNIIPDAISKGEGVKLPYIGKFNIPNGQMAKMPEDLIERQMALQTSGGMERIADNLIGY